MKSVKKIVIASLFLGLSQGLFAQDAETPVEPRSGGPIEEITVVGEATFSQLASQVEFAKLAVFNAYNDLNQDDYYDIDCQWVREIGSNISERVCQPAFIGILEAEAFQEQIVGLSLDPSLLQEDIREAALVMEANMVSLAEENPEFLIQTKEYMDLSARYEQLKDEHCGDKFFCWLNTTPDSQ